MSKNKKKIICTYCQTPIEDVKDDMVICNECGTPYHKDCWNEIEDCATYGCNSTSCHNVFDVNFKINDSFKQEEPASERLNNITDIGSNNSDNNELVAKLKKTISILIIIIVLISTFSYIGHKKSIETISQKHQQEIEAQYDRGQEDGYNSGYDEGQSDGYDTGFEEGEEEGFDTGFDEGQEEGYNSGYDQGQEDADFENEYY